MNCKQLRCMNIKEKDLVKVKKVKGQRKACFFDQSKRLAIYSSFEDLAQ